MVCSECSQENPESAVFCSGCGRALKVNCPSCEALNPRGAGYCSSCGAALQEGASVGEIPAAPHVLRCPRCQKANEAGSVYCANCGLPLDEGAPAQAIRQSPPGAYLAAWDLGRPAGFWIRFVAWLIDSVVLALATALLVAILFQENYLGALDDSEIWTVGDTLSVFLGIVYSVAMVAAYSGTLGKLLLGMRIVRTDGSRVGLSTAIFRFFAGFVSVLTLGIGYLMVAFRHDKRALHDVICGTVVIIKD